MDMFTGNEYVWMRWSRGWTRVFDVLASAWLADEDVDVYVYIAMLGMNAGNPK